ncbi:MAG: redox-sensing transcriptional repressor Rex [Erysipelotrichaceae bacterium]|nr:redox-sensing transcriptional repressor Rex [Erysipelotrichaceae bacterium]
MTKKISRATMTRYPVYLKALRTMSSDGKDHFMSYELSRMTGIKDTTIRRDFSFIPGTGHRGRRGVGYGTEEMIMTLSEVLGLELKEEPIILVGVGNLGRAMIKYNRWQYTVGHIVLAYDQDPELVGQHLGLDVRHIGELEETFPKGCKIAILAISDDVQETVDRLVALGIKGFVDFTHSHFVVPQDVEVQSVDVVVAIQELIMKMNTKN